MVVDELVLDRHMNGEVERISPEAPIPVLRVCCREHRAGNAGFVIIGLRGLGLSAALLSVVGADRNGEVVCGILREVGVETGSVVVDSHRSAIVKERFLGSVQSADRAMHQLLRVDEEHVWPVGGYIEDVLLERLPAQLENADAVLISDINKGLFTPRMLRAIISRARELNVPVIIDPRLSDDLPIYRGATNRYETEPRDRDVPGRSGCMTRRGAGAPGAGRVEGLPYKPGPGRHVSSGTGWRGRAYRDDSPACI
jgi:D-beta-D-heptose 7-phosphate kinase/D-beta-D-heptose 1-phosphate adenosyltransferase